MKTNSQAAEFKQKKSVAQLVSLGVQLSSMSPKVIIPEKIMFRPTPDDFSLVSKLGKKLGLGYSGIIRLALRRLAEVEFQKAS